ncbi:Alpha/Beta hydrolase protein [Lipomyces tetrasporus]|uniref:Carboxypeptidase n=1 Tax=Lipomyces tetrasporus TaxID=54092 RepID=A0AAD7QKP0_9ASCO|nr:Alpha/Beta hydrolase protein [Lipomyces tetrasporus]KAJ8097018.1 Alpha/Beta hydrolase protein [Lipomyces tetrasporus]
MRIRSPSCAPACAAPVSVRRPRNVVLLLTAVVALVLLAADLTYAGGSAADYFVSSLPGAPSDFSPPKMYAGHIEIKPEHHGNLFFWMFENEHIADKPRTVIWLNGGPGCSSMDGAMMEVGPFRVGEGGKLRVNEGRWNQFANLLFVDNPIGTGFSFVDTDSYLHELNEMADDFMAFMDKFFDMFPQYLVDDLYIAGESYAGMYIPYIADAILARKNNTDLRQYPLKGIMIGNGWIDPVKQYLSYVPFALSMGILEDGTDAAKKVDVAYKKCVDTLNQGVPVINVPDCEKVLDLILDVTQDMSQKDGRTCRNMYDLRKFDMFPACGSTWPDDLGYVTPYLRDAEVLSALHISPEKKTGWVECAGAVSRAFKAKNSKPSVDLLPGILEQIPVLMFNGDQDLICNHLGNEDLISQMKFNDGVGFEEAPGGAWAPRETWLYEGLPAGIYQSARNLTYVLIYNSSHMVPLDVPLESRDMLHRFMNVDYRFSGTVPPKSSVGDVASGNGTVPDTDSGTDEDADKKIQDATRAAYFRAGELALIIVALAATGFGAFVLYQRRQARKGGYRTVGFAKRDQMIRLEDGSRAMSSGTTVDDDQDNVNELDELVVESPVVTSDEIERRMIYDAGEILTEDEDDDDDVPPTRRSTDSSRSGDIVSSRRQSSDH